jgi:site-specific recombinase XerD
MSDIEPPARPIAKLPALAASGVPALVAALGERASYRFLEFFTANIRNPHTRRAYARAAAEFFDWLAARGVRELSAIESVHVAAYIEQKAYPFPSGMINILYVMGFAARPIARSERKAA